MGSVYIRGGGGLGNNKLRQATASPELVVKGRTFYSGNKELKTGTLPWYTDQNIPANIYLSTNNVNFYIPRGAYTFNGNIYTYVKNETLADALKITPGIIAAGSTVLGVSGTKWVPILVALAVAVTSGEAGYASTRYTVISSGYGTVTGGSGSNKVVFTVSKAGKYRISGASEIGENENGVHFDDGEDRDNKGSTGVSTTYYGQGTVSLAAGSKITITAAANPSEYDCVNGGSVSSRSVLISYVGE